MKKITKLIISALSLSVVISVTGCAVGPWGGLIIGNPFSGIAEARQAREYNERQAELKKEALQKELLAEKNYGPPQVIYRIDQKRYITLEKYTHCDNGQIFFHNDEKNIKLPLAVSSRSVMNYKGKFIWAAKSDNMLAFPLVRGGNDHCSDTIKNCAYSILSASNDGGEKFSEIIFGASNSSNSKEYTVVLTDDAIYTKRDKYPTDKFSVDTDGKFYNVRQVWVQDELYKGLLKFGVPKDVLANNRVGYIPSWLKALHDYSDIQIHEVDVKAHKLLNQLNNSPTLEKLPDEKIGKSISSEFTCNDALIPTQPKNQG